eukprot:11183425-Lingulodinium_polyedra.AAC.1
MLVLAAAPTRQVAGEASAGACHHPRAFAVAGRRLVWGPVPMLTEVEGHDEDIGPPEQEAPLVQVPHGRVEAIRRWVLDPGEVPAIKRRSEGPRGEARQRVPVPLAALEGLHAFRVSHGARAT